MIQQLFDFHRANIVTASRYTKKLGLANTRLGQNGSGCRAVSFSKDLDMMEIQGQREPKADGTGVPTSFQAVGPILIISVWESTGESQIFVEIEGGEEVVPGEDSIIFDKLVEKHHWLPMFLAPVTTKDQLVINEVSRLGYYLPNPKDEVLAALDDIAPGVGEVLAPTWGSLWRPGTKIIAVSDISTVKARALAVGVSDGSGSYHWVTHPEPMSEGQNRGIIVAYSDRTGNVYVRKLILV